jgi:aspartate aminotransferase
MTPKTKMIMINSPGNPTGSVYTREQLRAISEVAAEEEIFILSDEIYEKLTYEDTEHVSIASLTPEAHDLTITVNGFSKGLRDDRLASWLPRRARGHRRRSTRLQSHTTSNPCSFAQKGGLAALKGDQQCVNDMRDEFNIRREYVFDRLSKISGLSRGEASPGLLHSGQHRFLRAQVSGISADRLLSKANVAVVPGIAFGDDRTIRLSYATSLDVIKRDSIDSKTSARRCRAALAQSGLQRRMVAGSQRASQAPSPRRKFPFTRSARRAMGQNLLGAERGTKDVTRTAPEPEGKSGRRRAT